MLFHILKNTARIDIGIIKLLMKYAGSENREDINWYNACLEELKRNKHLSFFSAKKELKVYFRQYSEKYKQDVWHSMIITNKSQLNAWIETSLS